MMKISLCLTVLAFIAYRAYSRPLDNKAMCTLVQEGSFYTTKHLADAPLKKLELPTPRDDFYTRFECVNVYYDGLVKLNGTTSGLQKITTIIGKMKSTKHEGECKFELCSHENFLRKLNTFLQNLTINICT